MLRGSAPQRVLDLAIDPLELGVKIGDQHPQAPFAAVDDLPKLALLRARQPAVGEADSRLHDLTAPLPGAGAIGPDGLVWHALVPACRIWKV